MRTTLMATALMIGAAGPAMAGLEFCNLSQETASVSIGYSVDGVWTSEGWWVIEPDDCKTAVGGDLPNRYYYWRATTDAGEFPTEDYSFCTIPKVYTISGDEECEARGYNKSYFSQIDTGDESHFVVYLHAENAPGGASSSGGGNNTAPGIDLLSLVQGAWVDAEERLLVTVIDGNQLIDVLSGTVVSEGTLEHVASCGGRTSETLLRVVYSDLPQSPLCWDFFEIGENSLAFTAVSNGGVSRWVRDR